MENSSKTCSADPAPSPLPYTDAKPVGAADFYAAVNATFRFVECKLGREGLLRYWKEMGLHYYAPVTARWAAGGLPEVARYWTAFFAAEPGSEVEVFEEAEEVRVEVRTCPAIRFLREHGREIVPSFCQHCYHVSTAMGEGAGMDMRLSGGNGSCTQRFAKTGHFPTPQAEADILTAG